MNSDNSVFFISNSNNHKSSRFPDLGPEPSAPRGFSSLATPPRLAVPRVSWPPPHLRRRRLGPGPSSAWSPPQAFCLGLSAFSSTAPRPPPRETCALSHRISVRGEVSRVRGDQRQGGGGAAAAASSSQRQRHSAVNSGGRGSRLAMDRGGEWLCSIRLSLEIEVDAAQLFRRRSPLF